jgi:5-methylcytosine-specific restriction protein B
LFYQFCHDASRDRGNDFVFIIDEINRGNLSKILGELMTLIEADKRGPSWSVPLTYAESNQEQFHVPENLYILGLMNTADRSLSFVDYALRRRFAFKSLAPKITTSAFTEYLLEHGVAEELVQRIQTRIGALNEVIADKSQSNLGPAFCIGHSFFVPAADAEGLDISWYNRVIETEIIPLLKEYWFDNDPLVAEWRSRLVAEDE